MSKKPTKNQTQKLQQLVDQLTEENNQLNDALLRERADAENVRKRAEQERQQLAGFFKANTIKELLPVLDNLERALAEFQKNDSKLDNFGKGVESIYKQLIQILEKLGVQRIATVGQEFNPDTMEAVTMQEGDGQKEIVSEELQSGYILGDEVIRHAMVRVKS